MTVIAAGGGSDDGFVRGEVRPTKKDLADAVMMERAMENREGHRRQLGLNLIELRLMKWDEG